MRPNNKLVFCRCQTGVSERGGMQQCQHSVPEPVKRDKAKSMTVARAMERRLKTNYVL
jgi:hypothetical protein